MGRSSARTSRRSTLQAGVNRNRSFYGLGDAEVRTEEEVFAERIQYMNTALEALPGLTLRDYFTPVLRLQKVLILRKHRTTLHLSNIQKAIAAYQSKQKELISSDDEKQAPKPKTSSPAVPDPRQDEDVIAGQRIIMEALRRLGKSLIDMSGELHPGHTIPLDVESFAEMLQDKCEPVSYGTGEVLSYPNEAPESMFVYILLKGSVSVHHFQPNLQRSTIAGNTRSFFFSSMKDTVLLCGGGVIVGNPRAAALAKDAGGGDLSAGASKPGGGSGRVDHNEDTRSVNAESTTSAVSGGLIKNLRQAMRAVGHPTLDSLREETLRSPAVIGAAETLGLSPQGCYTIVAKGEAVGGGTGIITQSRLYGEHLDVLRIRMLDVHEALVEAAMATPGSPGVASSPFNESDTQAKSHRKPRKTKASGLEASSPKLNMLSTAPGKSGRGATFSDFILAAHNRVLSLHFPQNEVLMRQSWLLQDTPLQTIRHLIAHLTPRTYFPGDIMACPHGSSPRQLCFLRRGELYIAEPPSASPHRHSSCRSGNNSICNCDGRSCLDGSGVLEVVHPGASFGELSVLFGEPREYMLVAKTVCDVWCLSYRDFAQMMRCDDGLRKTLVQKAAALRIKWLAEQRFSPALTKHLRASSELFRPFPDIVLRLIQERIEPVVFSPGEIVASVAERCEEMIFIIQGRVESLVENLACYRAGQVIGAGCLVAHRWPISLSAKTMVEGWRLSRDCLLDALDRADMLHARSGERTTLYLQYLRQIFRPPLPEIHSSMETRNQMPIVPLAPGGLSYPEYGRRVSEILLRATCWLFRDFVRWEDINYASMTEAPQTKELAHHHAIEMLREEMQDSTGAAPKSVQKVSIADALAANPRKQQNTGKKADRTSRNDAKEKTDKKPKSGRGRQPSKRRRGQIGMCPFYVDENASFRPFIETMDRRPQETPQKSKSAYDKSFVESMMHKELLESCFAVQDTKSDRRLRRLLRIPPKLKFFNQLLDERDEMCKEGQLRDGNASLREGEASTAAPSSHRGAEGATTSGAASGRLANRERLRLVQAADLIREQRRSAYRARSKPGQGQRLDIVAPVHLFLQSERPKSELGMEEALAIGLVCRLPTAEWIEDCVPVVDPDVCVGLPQHRPRRHAMSVTPNERHHKNNFLFAAAVFEEESRQERSHRGGAGGTSATPSSQANGRSSSRDHRRSEGSRSSASSGGGSEDRGLGDEMTRAEQELHRSQVEAFTNLLRLNISAREQRKFEERQTPSSMDRKLFSSAQNSPSSKKGGRSGGNGSAFSNLSCEGNSPSPPSSRAASIPAPPSVATEALFMSHEDFIQAEDEMIELLLRTPQQGLESLFGRFEVMSSSQRAASISHSATPRMSVGGGGGTQFVATGFATSEGNEVSRTYGETPVAPLVGLPLERLQQLGIWPSKSTNSDEPEGVSGSFKVPPPPALNRNVSGKSSFDSLFRFTSLGQLYGVRETAQTPGSPVQASNFIDRHFGNRKKMLLVEGLGALNTNPRISNPAAPPLMANGRYQGSNVPCFSTSFANFPNENSFVSGTSMIFNTPGGVDGVGGASANRSQQVMGYSATLPDLYATMSSPMLPREKNKRGTCFVMPTPGETEEFMERMQRDVEGLNAVAAAQAHERETIRLKQLQRGKAYDEVQQALSQPTDSEKAVLDQWKTEHENLLRDPLRLSFIPHALLRHAGVNHLGIEIRNTSEEVASLAHTHRTVLAWHDQLEKETAMEWDVLESHISRSGTPTHTGQMRGVLKHSKRAGEQKSRGDGATSSNAAKRVLATVGTRQLGDEHLESLLKRRPPSSSLRAPGSSGRSGNTADKEEASPLLNPAKGMSEVTYSAWKKEREDFLENYNKMFPAKQDQ